MTAENRSDYPDHPADHGLADCDSRTFWLNGIVSMVLVIVGATGNVAVVVSFHCIRTKTITSTGALSVTTTASRTKRRRPAFYYYLMTFACWNTGLLLATLLFNCVPTILSCARGAVLNQTAYSITFVLGYLIGTCSVTANVWLAVVVTVERFMAVSRPFHSRLTSPRRRAKIVSIFLSVGAIAYNMPLIFEFIPSQHGIGVPMDIAEGARFENRSAVIANRSALITNRSAADYDDYGQLYGQYSKESYVLRHSPMRLNIYYKFVYRVLANFLFVSGVPFAVVLLLTIKIVCVVRESDKRRAKFRYSSVRQRPRRQQSVAGCQPGANNSNTVNYQSVPNANSMKDFGATSTHMSTSRYAHVILTLIAIKFLICYSLPVIINLLELAAPSHLYESINSDDSRTLAVLVDVSNLLEVIDGATNAFFYFSWRNRIRVRTNWSRIARKTSAPMGSETLTVRRPLASAVSLGLAERSSSPVGRDEGDWLPLTCKNDMEV